MQCVPVNLSDRAAPREFSVYCGDTTLYFRYLYNYRRHYLKKVLEDHARIFEKQFFPGLVLQDPNGVLYRAKLSVVLEPIVEEVNHADGTQGQEDEVP